MKFRTLLPGALLVIGVMLSAGMITPAQAQVAHQCASGPGPDEVIAYRTPDSSAVAGVPFCYYADDLKPQQQQRRAPTPHPSEALAAMMPAFNASMTQMAKLMSNTELMAFNNGGLWKYPSTPEQCKAVYMNPQGVLAIFGPTKSFDGVAFMFQADTVPKRAKPAQISVELEERNLATGKVQRIPFQALSDSDSVTMVYEGKFFGQAVDSMIDKAQYRVLLKNKPIVEMGFHNGLQAKAKLKACIAGRR